LYSTNNTSKEILELLIKNGADVNATFKMKKRNSSQELWRTPLYICYERDLEEWISIFKPLSNLQLNLELAMLNGDEDAIDYFS